MPQKYLWLWFFCCFFLRVIKLTFQAFQKQFCKFHVTPAFSCSKSDSIQGCIGIEHVLIEEQKSAFERKGGIQLEKVQTISIQQFPNNFGHFCFWLSETYKWPQSLFCWKTQPKSNPRHLIRMIMIPNQPTKRPWQRQIRDHLENKNKSLGVKLTFFQRAHQGQMRTQ